MLGKMSWSPKNECYPYLAVETSEGTIYCLSKSRGGRENENIPLFECRALFIYFWWDQESVQSFSLLCLLIGPKSLIPCHVIAHRYFRYSNSEFERPTDRFIFNRNEEFMNHDEIWL